MSLDDVLSNPLTRDLADVTNIKYLFSSLSRIKAYENRQLSLQDIALVLLLNSNDSRVNRLMNKLGVNSIEELAKAIYDNYSSATPIITSQETTAMINGLLTSGKKFNNLDIPKAIDRISSLYTEFEDSSYEHSVQKVIDDLNNKYKLDFDDLQVNFDNIKSAKELTGSIILSLSRQLKELENQYGTTEETINLEEKIKELSEVLEHKRYFYGFSSYLSEMSDVSEKLKELLIEYDNVTGTPLERSTKRAKIINELKNIVSTNKYILNLLSNDTSILRDAGLTHEEISTIQQYARDLLTVFTTIDNNLAEKADSTMLEFMTEIIGKKGVNGVSAKVITSGLGHDSSIYDYLYCASKLSDPRGALVGTLIREAQDSRDLAMRDIANRIKRATYKLRDAGITDTSFMYEDNGYIISDIDWGKYWKARRKHINNLKKEGLKGIELKEAIDAWDFNNTEERVVDSKSGRTEVIPNGDYRKPFPNLTEEQMEYYKTMMQIKGEMGTLLPNVAQKHYVPPQIRRGFWDAVKAAKGFKDICDAIKNLCKGIYTIWEDDADFYKSGILVDGEEFTAGTGDLKGRLKKEVPIRYLNRVSDQKELLKDFSGALTMFSGMAINYSAMHKVCSTVEFIHSQVESKTPKVTDPKTGNVLVDTFNTGKTRIVQALQKEGSAKTQDLIRQIIDT
jgi:copper chaperone CopZ